jgi:hypothetical protein
VSARRGKGLASRAETIHALLVETSVVAIAVIPPRLFKLEPVAEGVHALPHVSDQHYEVSERHTHTHTHTQTRKHASTQTRK